MKATLEVINRMQADGVIGKYAIGGAVGATFYLEPAATLDLDIFVSLQQGAGSSLLTLTPIYKYLTAHGHQIKGEYIMIAGWPVQFLPPADALGEEALTQARSTDVEGVPTWVMTAEHLVALALQTGRAKDNNRILQFVESGLLDLDQLGQILARHALQQKWEQFSQRFLKDQP
jgi:hypothetical protein